MTRRITRPPKHKAKGFAALGKRWNREISSRGGKAAQAAGKGRRFTSEDGKILGRQGGLAAAIAIRAKKEGAMRDIDGAWTQTKEMNPWNEQRWLGRLGFEAMPAGLDMEGDVRPPVIYVNRGGVGPAWSQIATQLLEEMDDREGEGR